MELEHDFTVPVPKAQAWAALMDVERVAPCMPGATFDGYVVGDPDGDAPTDGFKGRVKVKLGPITVTYNGSGRFVERDEAAGRAVIEASGKEARGSGTANATITAQLTDEGETTKVSVVTDLNVTGKPAQFGRGVMNEVGAKLVGQFADHLAEQLGEGAPAAEASEHGGEASAPAQAGPAAVPPRPSADAIDLMDTAGAPVLKRVVPLLAGLVAMLLVWRLLRRRSR